MIVDWTSGSIWDGASAFAWGGAVPIVVAPPVVVAPPAARLAPRGVAWIAPTVAIEATAELLAAPATFEAFGTVDRTAWLAERDDEETLLLLALGRDR